MAKLKLTKNELKRQKDALKRFQRYLPTLELKKKQLLAEIRRVLDRMDVKQSEMDRLSADVNRWVAVFAEDVDVRALFEIRNVRIREGNVAGIDIPEYDGVDFENKEYDLMRYPLWVDRGIPVVQQMIEHRAELEILHQQEERLREEMRTTMQRINLFEKIKIPQAQDNIRRIRIALGDLQTAQVVRGKIAKHKLEQKSSIAGFSGA